MKRRHSNSDECCLLPASAEDAKHLSRRSFLAAGAAALTAAPVAVNLPMAWAQERQEADPPHRFTAEQRGVMTALTEHLLPKGANSPGAGDVNAVAYMEFTVFREGMDPGLQRFFLRRIATVQEASQERFSTPFPRLDETQRELLVGDIARHTHWGEHWLALVLGYVLEALLADPVYGGNPGGIGWRWLQHRAGFPRPPRDKIYTRLK
ncbi:MAG: gluconate 2-dehydrogenase subunit 3 family protein [Lysobacterales bacterium]|jgi:gluconate 2-dehydrogenase gamma chain